MLKCKDVKKDGSLCQQTKNMIDDRYDDISTWKKLCEDRTNLDGVHVQVRCKGLYRGGFLEYSENALYPKLTSIIIPVLKTNLTDKITVRCAKDLLRILIPESDINENKLPEYFRNLKINSIYYSSIVFANKNGKLSEAIERIKYNAPLGPNATAMYTLP